MDWSDEGIVLSARRHGESAAIVTLLTREHGRHLGLVRGGAGRRARGTYEPGNEVAARWRARLEDHLGTFTCELVINHAARLMDEPARLAALAAACAVADSTLPEREPLGPLYSGLRALLLALQTPGWAEAYVRWELALLRDLGFGLTFRRARAGPSPRPPASPTGTGSCRCRPSSWRGKGAPRRAPGRARRVAASSTAFGSPATSSSITSSPPTGGECRPRGHDWLTV
jgi:DNA repair protein RecO